MKVFISSTYKDLRDYRTALKDALAAQDHEPIVVAESEFREISEKARMQKIREADVFIGLFAHLYGHMDKNSQISVLEQEYRLASKLQKDIIICLVDPAKEWPAHLLEDDFIEQDLLKKLRKELQEKHTPMLFRSPVQLTSDLSPRLLPLSEKHDRLKKLQAWATRLSPARKIDLIQQLSLRHKSYGFSAKDLSDGAFIKVTKLIANNFQSSDEPISRELIDDTEKLLKGELKTSDFTVRANHFRRQKLKEFLRNNSRNVLTVMVIIAAMLGIFLGSLLFPGESTASESDKLQGHLSLAINDLADNDKSRLYQTLQDSFPAIANLNDVAQQLGLSQTQPEAAIVLVSQQSEEPVETNRSPAEIAEATVPENDAVIENNKAAVEEQAESSEENEASAESNPPIEEIPPVGDNAELGSADTQPADTLTSTAPTDSMVLAQIAVTSQDTMTIAQALASWEAFRISPELTAIAQTYTAQEIERLTQALKSSAQISAPGAFLTCSNVNRETRMPDDTTAIFSPGKVWMWARIKTPRDETITAKWMVNGRELYSNSATIPAGASGYRIYFSKTHSAATIGNNEIRLYNKDNQLFARRSYQVMAASETQQ